MTSILTFSSLAAVAGCAPYKTRYLGGLSRGILCVTDTADCCEMTFVELVPKSTPTIKVRSVRGLGGPVRGAGWGGDGAGLSNPARSPVGAAFRVSQSRRRRSNRFIENQPS